MALTVAETVKELERLKHQRAVWMETVEHLSKFIDKESRQADHGIAAEGCIHASVPQDVVREFIDLINDEEIEPLNQEIGALENLHVEEEENGEEGDPDEEESRKKEKGKSKKGVLQGRGKKKGPTAGVRRLARPPKRKSQSTS